MHLCRGKEGQVCMVFVIHTDGSMRLVLFIMKIVQIDANGMSR